MKRAEYKTWNEVKKYILARHHSMGHIGEIWVETFDNEIRCFWRGICYIIFYLDGKKIKIRPVARGLIQARWFLEQLKKR